MIETITPAGCGSRRRHRFALAAFAVGSVASAALVGAALGALGALLPGGGWAPAAAVAALALLALAREAGVAALPLPQSRRQVPERWRAELPLPVWSSGYGAGLGAGLLTYQPVATFWVAAAGAVALARPAIAAACLSLYGGGRALMVVLPAHAADPAAVVERLVARRRALGRANVAVLAGCCAALATASVAAAAVVPLGGGSQLDPSVSRGVLAYTQREGDAVSVVVRAGRHRTTFEGAESPALDGPRLAYADAEGIRVVHWQTGEELVRAPGALSRPALEWPFLAFVASDRRGSRLVVSNLETGRYRVVARVGATGDLGRPSLRRGRLAWHVVRARESQIVLLHLATRRRSVVARSRIARLSHPAATGTHVLWVDERAGVSSLLVRRLSGGRVRELARLRGGRAAFWTTALAGRAVYVSRWDRVSGRTRLQRLRL